MKKNISNRIKNTYADGHISDVEAGRRLFFKAEDDAGAVEFLKARYLEAPRPMLLEELGNIHFQRGQLVEAEMAYTSALFRSGNLQSPNLIQLRYPAVAAHVDDAKKVLYIPSPKNASSTIKNYLSLCTGGEEHGEAIHFNMKVPRVLVTLEDMRTKYADYFKFAVIRDPVERVASYLSRNVEGGALERLAYGAGVCRDLSTKPCADEVAEKFDQFRQLFLDFRHHTNAQVYYLWPFIGNNSGLEIYTMGGVGTIRHKLQDLYGCELPELRSMSSGPASPEKSLMLERLAPLREHYQDDYHVFGEALQRADSPNPIVKCTAWRPKEAAGWRKASTYHTAASALLEARRLRRLAKWAIRRVGRR
ncbi:sulfotransferase family 2 domain-containing protein [Poseidonocella sp. HB161398]|uniref:sulfotransferase family 2 domain-containing protein n=1 Tax=Poseidonocella sp. HB161398 TaxID=2320855 RepID=UPI001486A5E0|nr:sulfotransferase family 2 domain-containing protein [Poseidonocella sp. HB161398]